MRLKGLELKIRTILPCVSIGNGTHSPERYKRLVFEARPSPAVRFGIRQVS